MWRRRSRGPRAATRPQRPARRPQTQLPPRAPRSPPVAAATRCRGASSNPPCLRPPLALPPTPWMPSESELRGSSQGENGWAVVGFEGLVGRIERRRILIGGPLSFFASKTKGTAVETTTTRGREGNLGLARPVLHSPHGHSRTGAVIADARVWGGRAGAGEGGEREGERWSRCTVD